MEAPPSTEMVLQAIRTLYHSENLTQKAEAEKWLQGLQKSVHAWKVRRL